MTQKEPAPLIQLSLFHFKSAAISVVVVVVVLSVLQF